MRRYRWMVPVLSLAVGLLCATGARADSFSWSVTGSDVSGSGAITATNEGGGEYLVTAMTGDLFITYGGTTTGGAITFIPYTGAPGTSAADSTGLYIYDDLIFPSSTPELDPYGLLFDVAGFADPLNLCGGSNSSETCSTATSDYIQWDVNTSGPSNGLGYGSNYNAYGVTFSVTPEPSSMLLLATGLAGLALLAFWRKRSAPTVSQAL